MKFLKDYKKWIAPALFIIAAVCLPLFVTNTYRLYFFATIALSAIAASGLDVLMGCSGQISIGHIAYYAIGAYATAMFTKYTNVPVIVSIIVSAFFAAAIGALVALPCAKLRYMFLALASIAFANVVYQLICQIKIFNGYRGLAVKPLQIFGINMVRDFTAAYYFCVAVLLIFLLLKHLIIKSKYGRAFMAIRDNTRSADGIGINVRRYKVIAFAISAFFVGFAGATAAHLNAFVISDSYIQANSFSYIIMIVFGGVNTIFGPVLGAVVYQIINEALIAAAAWRGLIYGVILLVFLGFLPGGCMGGIRKIQQLIVRALSKRTEKAAMKGDGNHAES